MLGGARLPSAGGAVTALITTGPGQPVPEHGTARSCRGGEALRCWERDSRGTAH